MRTDLEAQIEQILDLVEKGESLDALAAQAGVPTALVRDRALAIRGQTWWAEHVVRGRPVDPEDVDRGLALITWGVPPEDAAERAGVAISTLKRHGARLHGPEWWAEAASEYRLDREELSRAIGMLEGGASVVDAAAELDTVGLALRRAVIDHQGEDWWEQLAHTGDPDDRTVDWALDMLATGVWVGDAAAEVGTTPEVLRARAETSRGRAWWIRRVARRVAPETIQEGVDAIQEGCSLAEAATLADVTQTTLRRQCIELMGPEWWARNVVERSDTPAGVLDGDTLATVIETYRDAGPFAAAEILGVDRTDLHDVLREALGEEAYRELVPDRRVSPEAVEELIALFEAGTPLVEAAEEVGVGSGTAYRWVRRSLGELEYRRLVGRVGWASAGVDVERLANQLEEGVAPSEIADRAGLSAPTIRVLLASHLGVSGYRRLADDPSHTLPTEVESSSDGVRRRP